MYRRSCCFIINPYLYCNEFAISAKIHTSVRNVTLLPKCVMYYMRPISYRQGFVAPKSKELTNKNDKSAEKKKLYEAIW